MGKRDELIAKYADDLREKCRVTPDMELLTKVTVGCGPAIYNTDSSTVAGSLLHLHLRHRVVEQAFQHEAVGSAFYLGKGGHRQK